MSNIVQIDRQNDLKPAPMTPLTPMAMVSYAIDRGADLETVKQLLDLRDREDAKQARRAFDAAMAAAKAEIPVVRKNRSVSYGSGKAAYAHEDLGEIARTVDPVLAQHGLSYRFRPEQRDGRVRVTCIIAHVDGHNEESTLEAAADTSGSKNSIQAIGSTVTYLQRYTLKMALGLAASEDNDARDADGAEVISDEQADTVRRLLQETSSNVDAFLIYVGVPSIADIPASKYQQAIVALNSKRKSGGQP